MMPTTPSKDSASKLRAALLKGDVWQQPDRTPSSHPPAAKLPPTEALLPAMSAAAQVASAWVEMQDERAACCPDWHERSALSTPHTPAGQRLDAVLHVVEDAVDAQIAKIEKEVSRGKDAGASYSVAHLLAWLRQAQERSAMADRRARAAEVKAKRNADALAAQQRETEQATARIQSFELEIESLKSTAASLLARATAAELSLAAANSPGAPASARTGSLRSAARKAIAEEDDEEEEEEAAEAGEAALAGEAVAVVPPSPPSFPNRARAMAPFVPARGPGRIKSRAGSSARGDARVPAKKKPDTLGTGNSSALYEDMGGDDRHFPTGDDRLASAWVALRRLQTSLLLSATLLDQASSERTAEAGADAATDLVASDGGFVDYGSLGPLLGERFASAAAATAVAARDMCDAPPNRVHRARGATGAVSGTHASGRACDRREAIGAVSGTNRPLDAVANVEEMLRRLQVLLRLHATNGATEAAADDDDDDAGEAAVAAAARRAALTLHTVSLLPPVAAELAGLASRAETLRLKGAQTHARLSNGRNTLALWHCAAVSEGRVRRIVSAWRCEARLSRLRVELLDERDYRLELNAELQACKAEKASLQAQLGALRHASSLALERIETQLDELTTAPAPAVHLLPPPADAFAALAERQAERSTPHAHQADHHAHQADHHAHQADRDAYQDVSSAQTERSLPASYEQIRLLQTNPNPKASYEQIRQLQTLTGRGLKDCKRALNENSCDVKAAVQALARTNPHLESPAEAFSRPFRTTSPAALGEAEEDDLVEAVPWANSPLASFTATEVAAAESDVTDSEAVEAAKIAAEMKAAATEAAAIEATAADAEAADVEAADAEAADATEVQAEVVEATPPRQVEPTAKRTPDRGPSPDRGPPPPSPAVRMAAVQAAAAFLLAAEAEAEAEEEEAEDEEAEDEEAEEEEAEEEEAEEDWTPTRPEAVSEAGVDAKAEEEEAPLRALPIALPATPPQLLGVVLPPTPTAPPTPTPFTPADAPSAAGSEAPTSHSSHSVQERRKRLLLVSQASRILSRG